MRYKSLVLLRAAAWKGARLLLLVSSLCVSVPIFWWAVSALSAPLRQPLDEANRALLRRIGNKGLQRRLSRNPPVDRRRADVVDSISSRTLTLQVKDAVLRARWDVAISRTSPFVEDAWKLTHVSSLQEILRAYLGEVTVAGEVLTFRTPSVEYDSAGTAWLHFHAHARRLADLTPDTVERGIAYRVWVNPPEPRIHADTAIVQVLPGAMRLLVTTNLPTEQSSSRTLFTSEHGTATIGFALYQDIPLLAPTPVRERNPQRPTLARILASGANIHIPGVSPLLRATLEVLPLLLLMGMVLRRDFRTLKRARIIWSVAFVATTFAALQGSIPTIMSLSSELPWLGNVGIESFRLLEFRMRGTILGKALVYGLVLLVFWPALTNAWEPSHASWSLDAVRRRRGTGLIGWLSLGMAVTSFAASWGMRDEPGARVLAGVGSAAAVLLGSSALAAELRLAPIWRSVAATSAIVAVAATLSDFDQGSRQGPLGMAVLFTCAMYRWGTTAARLAVAGATGAPVQTRAQRRAIRGGALVAAAVSLAMGFHLSLSRGGPPDFTWLTSLPGTGYPLFAALAAMLLVGVLHEVSPAGGKPLGPLARRAGILLVLTFFFPSTDTLFYIPVQFLLGAWLLNQWLLAPTVEARPSPGAGSVSEAIGDMIRLNELGRAMKGFRKEMFAKFTKGEITFEEYDVKLDSLERTLKDKRQQLRTVRQAVLAWGPSDSAWENGLSNARWAAFFAVPWVLVYLHDVLGRGMDTLPIPFVASTAFALAKWALIGFFFGYFYPLLRGRDGLEKALTLFCALMLPLAVQQALSAPKPAEWRGFAFLALQLLIHSLLLGVVANDYAVIRKYDFGWRSVLEVHNLGALAAWGSTLVVAIGTTLSTLLSSQAPRVVKAAFEQWSTPAPALEPPDSTQRSQQPAAGADTAAVRAQPSAASGAASATSAAQRPAATAEQGGTRP